LGAYAGEHQGIRTIDKKGIDAVLAELRAAGEKI
jgi:ribosomal protein L28